MPPVMRCCGIAANNADILDVINAACTAVDRVAHGILVPCISQTQPNTVACGILSAELPCPLIVEDR